MEHVIKLLIVDDETRFLNETIEFDAEGDYSL